MLYIYSDTESCWSAVGMDAEKIIAQDKPTMMLNLKGFPLALQRSLVIHQFGHALGLDHEHQWSDFWEVVKEFFDKSKISESQMLRVKKREDMAESGRSSPYDRHSIMHYRWADSIVNKASFFYSHSTSIAGFCGACADKTNLDTHPGLNLD